MIRKLIKFLEVPNQEVQAANKLDLEKYNNWLNQPVQMELVVKRLPGLYLGARIPDEVDSQEKAVECATLKSIQLKSETCLILSRKKCLWFNSDGSLKFEGKNKDGIVKPFMVVGNKQFIFEMGES